MRTTSSTGSAFGGMGAPEAVTGMALVTAGSGEKGRTPSALAGDFSGGSASGEMYAPDALAESGVDEVVVGDVAAAPAWFCAAAAAAVLELK